MSGTHWLSSQCCPLRQRLGCATSHVGLTQLKLMLAEASPARAPSAKIDVLIVDKVYTDLGKLVFNIKTMYSSNEACSSNET